MSRAAARNWIASGAVFLAGLLVTGAVFAAKPPPSPKTAPAVQTVLDCRQVPTDAARLACYDKAVDAMATATKTGDLVAIDKAQRRAARQQAFGLPLNSLSFLDNGEKPEDANRITGKVAKATQIAGGRWVFVLESGAVWRQIDDQELPMGAHKGSELVIMRGVLSYMVKVDGQQAIKMHRDS